MFKSSHTLAITKEAEAYCTHLLREKLPLNIVFHNYHHTAQVVEAAQEIGFNSGLKEEELQTVAVAAWFHDTGYRLKYEGHEEISMQFAAEFLGAKGVDTNFQHQVLNCIEATKRTAVPRNPLEQVICDADLSHLGKSFYTTSSLILKKEIELTTGVSILPKDWHRQNLVFLKTHTYFTAYARKAYDGQKRRNLQEERRLLLLQE